MRRVRLAIAFVGLLVMNASPVGATEWLIPPVDGPIAERFDPPDSHWGPGHRGIDYAVPPGTAVRAAGTGTVTFAGPVAATVAVTIDHGGGMETTYTDLGDALVVAGQTVTQGHVIGHSAAAHAGGI